MDDQPVPAVPPAYNPKPWEKDDGTFHLGINMAGAISAGAYTAGALDFLMEAIEQWYVARETDPDAPRHKLSIEVFSGASAGGMCAAIASVMVQAPFDHIRDPFARSKTPSSNRFYESWVNKIDIDPLLQDTDLNTAADRADDEETASVISLLDSSVIDAIADYAIVPPANATTPPPYISPSLTLFLALTNVRGTPFSLQGQADNSAAEECIAYYADRLQFETVADGRTEPLAPRAKPLPLSTLTGLGKWPLLKEAAKATGAFPLFLAPRVLQREADDYRFSPWQPVSITEPCAVEPKWNLPAGGTLSTLNVDGGVTDNDPFQLAHDYLAIHNPLARPSATGELENPRKPDEANCAVLTIAPFPSKDVYNSDFDVHRSSGVLQMLPRLMTTLISQSRFLGESLPAVLHGSSVSRFVMAPSGPDTDPPNKDALQCSVLGAFGGFFERGFRAHDYQLGRRNCQQFLREHFRLAVGNPIFQGAMPKEGPARDALVERSKARKPLPGAGDTLPIIPLYGTAVDEVPLPSPARITMARLNHVVGMVIDRLHAVSKPLLDSMIGTGFESWALRSALNGYLATLGRAKLKAYLRKTLAEVIAD